MLWAERNDKGIAADDSLLGHCVRMAAFDGRGLFDGEIPAEGIDFLGPVIRDEQPLAGARA